jgi:hypothetical protein
MIADLTLASTSLLFTADHVISGSVNSIELPIGWLLSTVLGLGGVIATLAGIIYKSLSARLECQDRIIDGLRSDITRMSKGCGVELCHWRNHSTIP